MKKLLFLILLPIVWSCNDDCSLTQTFYTTVPFQVTQEQLLVTKSVAPISLKNPGKIYAYNQYLFIAQVKKGIHIIDNSDPTNPKNISFLQIPGIMDLAVKDNILYADSYTDLVVFDLSNPLNIIEKARMKNQFNFGLVDGISWYYDPNTRIITDYEWKKVTQTTKTNCGNSINPYPIYYRGIPVNSSSFDGSKANSSGNGSTGTGGSMARFTIYQNYLYAATNTDLMVFDIKNQIKPDNVTSIKLGWGIETIFPYNDKLFIGSNTGMFIFENKDPRNPVRLSIFQHARACDPVVVEGNKAYVTLREGRCGTAPNQLDIVDISNLTSPSLLKSYNMENPHGLSVLGNKLTLCEGAFGLKSIDVSNTLDIKINQHLKGFDAYDVIQLTANRLLMIGKDGLFQYDNSDPKNLKLLSKIPVEKP